MVLFTKDFWKYGVVGRPVIIVLQREANKKARASNKVVARLCDFDGEHPTFKSYQYPQSYFDSMLYNRFRLFFDAKSKRFVEAMEQDAVPLGKIVSFASGLIGQEGKDSIVSTKKLSNKWLPGLLSGGEIRRYSITYAGNYILYDKSKLHSGFKDADYFSPKIFMRQTGDTIIASYDDVHYLCLNNLHVGNLIDQHYDLKYVLACLNSSALNHYYHLISLEFGRAMAQTDIETLELLPIKQASEEQKNAIVKLVDRLLTLHRQPAQKQIQAELDGVDRDIDDRVCELYGVSRRSVTERA